MRLVLLWALSLLAVQGENTDNLLRYAKGVFAESDRDWQTARSHYEETLAQDPDCYPLVRKVVAIQNRKVPDDPNSRDLSAATATFRTFAENNRKHLGAQLDYAAFLRQHAPRDAIAQQAALKTLELAAENFPHTSPVFSPLISLYENLERRADSLRVLQAELAAPSEDPNHWLALIPQIKTLYPADDPSYTTLLAKAMAQVEEHGIARASIARRVSEFHRSQGRIDQAITALEKHLAASPSSHSLRTRLGLLHLSNQDEAAGEKTLLEVLAIDPDQSLAHSSLAKLYTKRDEPLLALKHRAEVLRIRGGTPEEAIAVADEYLALEKPHEARLLLEKFRFNHPESPGIHARLAMATLRDGLTEEAARLFRQAESLAEESKEADAQEYLDADFQIEFALTLIAANDLQSAETRLRQAAQGLDLDAEPQKYARAVTALAKLWLDQGKNEAPAQALLQRALLLDPENQEAAKLLK